MRNVQSTLFALLAASGSAFANSAYNLTPGVSYISRDVYQLHMLVFWVCVGIGIIVFGAMFYAMYFHRKSKGAKPAEFHSHPGLEITWTIIPVIILLLMAFPATKVLLAMNNNDKEDMTIKVTGYQWKWRYEYIEDNISFFSNLSTPQDQLHNLAPKGVNYLREVDRPLVVPIHKKIRFLITSNDVNHSWWVPDFAFKRDAVAGFINEGWAFIDKPGTYRGQCAELCGIGHGFMPIVVVATTEQGYKDWVAQQKGQASQGAAETNRAWTMKELMDKGEQIYSHICAACHQPGGVGLPPTFPALKGSKIATGPIAGHIDRVMNGKNGTAMQAFKNQLSDVEIASVITYERNAFGNNTGTMVQPIQIKAVRDGKAIADALAVQPTGATPVVAPPSGPAPTTPTPAGATPSAPATSAAPTTPAAPAIPVGAAPTAAAPASGAPVVTATPVAAAPVTTAGTVPTVTTPAASAPATTPVATPTPAAPAGTASTAATPALAAPAASASTTAPVTATTVASTAAAPAATVATTTTTATTTTVATTSATTAAVNPDDLKAAIARGEKVYLGTCAVCHQPAGTGLPPTFPALKGSPIATGPVAGHINRVMNGKPGTAMVAFKDQLSDQDIADVITYERNAFGNNTGTLVRPEDIKAARQQGPTTTSPGASP